MLILLSGLGAIGGPIVTGWMMGIFGPPGYFIFLAMLMIALAVYSAYRMTVRPAPSVEDTGSYAPILPSATVTLVSAIWSGR